MRSADDVVAGSRAIRMSDDIARSLSQAERKALDTAELDFVRASPYNTLVRDLELLQAAADIVRKERQIGRSVSPFDQMPNLRVRLASDRAFDAVIVRYANARLGPMLRQRFDSHNMRIVQLGMADDMAASTRETEAFAALVGRGRIDRHGGFADLPRLGQLQPDQLRLMLSPYRGKTVVLVGHIPENASGFFVFGSNGERIAFDLKVISDVAQEMGINLIPLGCKSAAVGRIGLTSNVNSRMLARRLRNAANSDPPTMGRFLDELAGPDMEILIDPFDAKLFSSGSALINRRTGEDIGRVLLRNLPREQEKPALISYSPCLASKSLEDFATCLNRTVQREFKLVAEKRAAVAQHNRTMALSRIDGEIAAALRAVDAAEADWVRYGFLYGILGLIAWLYYVHVMLGVAFAEREEGSPIRGFSRQYLLVTLQSPRFLAENLGATWRHILYLLGGAVFVIVAFFPAPGWMWDAMYWGAGIALAIAFVRGALAERMLTQLFALPAIGAISIAGAAFAMQGAGIDELQQEAVRLEARKADLKSDSPNAEWRKVWDWQLDFDPGMAQQRY